MGSHPNVTWSSLPKQGRFKNLRVIVMFHYDASKLFPGTVVRDDNEEPFRTIIKLDDGRYVLADECQYSFEK